MRKDQREDGPTKPRRQEMIKEIVENHVVETQEDLAEYLRRAHIPVTQATVSRDIKEMMLVKVPLDGGRSRYAIPETAGGVRPQSRLEGFFTEDVTGVDASGNIVVLRTLPGMAGAVAAALDAAEWKEIIGTLAGDDTILAVVKPADAADSVAERLRKLLGGKTTC